MKKNMGTLDRRIRTTTALIISLLFFGGVITGVWGNILFTIALVFFATSIFSVCPLYYLFGINTCSAKGKRMRK